MNLDAILSSPNLPSPPSTALQLLQLSKAVDSEVNDYVRVVRTDPALCGKLLKAANSPLFGARSEITTVERAVPMLGITSLTALTMGFSLSNDSIATGPLKQHYEQYWKQSVIQAVTAERIDVSASRDQRAERFMTGLMLDIGRLAMLKAEPAEYVRAIEESQTHQQELPEVESESFGFTHAHVGAELLSAWGLPESLIQIVRNHHLSEMALNSADGDSQACLFASAVGQYFCSAAKCDALRRLNETANQFYGLSESQVQTFLDDTRERLDTTCKLFSINPDEIPSPADLLAEANDQLIMISLRTQHAQSEAEIRRRELEQQNRDLREESIRDTLTGVFNRRFFEESLTKELSRATRTGKPIGLLFLDIDHFKNLNDTHGHLFGDLVLAQVAGIIERESRESDVVARYGGEEFVVLLTETTADGIDSVAERIRASVESLEVTRDGDSVPVTISIGAASSESPDDTPKALIGRADEMVYESKRAGRNRVTVYRPGTVAGAP